MRALTISLMSFAALSLGGCSLFFDSEDYETVRSVEGCDEDGDGFESTAPGCDGTDCDDTRATVYPGAPPDCSTDYLENCEHSSMVDFLNGIMGGDGSADGNAEAGYLPTFRVENRQLVAPRFALSGTSAGLPEGTGYILWAEGSTNGGDLMVLSFGLDDPQNYGIQSMVFDHALGDLTEVVDVAACATSTTALGVTAVRAHSGELALRAQIGTLAHTGSGLLPSFTAMPSDVGAMSALHQFPNAGVTNCFYDSPGVAASEPTFHVVHGTIDNMSDFVARQPLPGTSPDFAFTTAGTVPQDAGWSFFGTGGRHIFYPHGNLDQMVVWDANTVSDQPTSFNTTDGDPMFPGGDVSIGYVQGSSASTQRYLMAVPQNDLTFIHTVDCVAPGSGSSSCTVDLGMPSDTIPDMGAGQPSLTAMSTWHATFGGTGAVIATSLVDETSGRPAATLHFLTDNGQHFPVYGSGQEDQESIGDGFLEDYPVALRVASVNDEDGITVLIAALEYGDVGGRYDIQVGGFQICRRP